MQIRVLTVFSFSLLLFALLACKPARPSSGLDYEAIEYRSEKASEADRKVVKQFADFKMELSRRLTAAMQEGGPQKAIEVCRVASPEIEKSFSGEAQVLRVSQKPRNPDHRASKVESMVLDLWAARLKEGKPIGAVVVPSETGRVVMAPIQISGEMCLQCHGVPGEQIKPETAAALKKAYPADEATGYALNDLRGAFVARFTNQ
jgi:hypothetical protein